MSDFTDPTLASAIDLARVAAVEAAGGEVGEHVGVSFDAERLASHLFESFAPGYGGWYWSVSVSRAPDDDRVTVNDVVMLPGETSVVAPAWTPYKDRIRPGDLSPGDVLPPEVDDVRLVPAWAAGDGAEQTPDRFFVREVGLGREWVMSLEGRTDAADRWHSGEFGPEAPIAQQASGVCGSCGFMVSLAGDLADKFGVCGNGQANADGRVVALSHGCGAHSGAKLKRSAAPQKLPPHVVDTLLDDELEPLALPDPEPEVEAVAQVDDVAAEEGPVAAGAAVEASVEETPAEDTPAEETPVEETLVEDAPAEELPAEEAQLEEAQPQVEQPEAGPEA